MQHHDFASYHRCGTLEVRIPAPRVDLDEDGPTVSVVIPAKNEARNLPWLAERMPHGLSEIILVDGRSTDDTVDVASSLWPGLRVVTQNRKGKGNALCCGFAAANGDIIVMLDADGSMDPGEIPYFVAALLAGADYAKGSRFVSGGGSEDITRFRAAGNRALTLLTGLMYRTAFTDLCYGYNAFWRRILPYLELESGDGLEPQWGDGFEVETLMNIRVHLAELTIAEVPSYEARRIFGVSNLRALPDGWRVLSTIANENRRHRAAEAPRNTIETHTSVGGAMAVDGLPTAVPDTTAPEPHLPAARATQPAMLEQQHRAALTAGTMLDADLNVGHPVRTGRGPRSGRGLKGRLATVGPQGTADDASVVRRRPVS